MAFLVARVTADELENPPWGMLPVEIRRRPRNRPRPSTSCTRAPRLPLRSVRIEAMALPTRANGRRMLLLTHRVGGGSGTLRSRRRSSSSSLKYPSESSRDSLMCVPNTSYACRSLTSSPGYITASSEGTKFTLSRYIGFIGSRWIRRFSASWASITICSLPLSSPAPIGICQAGP